MIVETAVPTSRFKTTFAKTLVQIALAGTVVPATFVVSIVPTNVVGITVGIILP